jgi:hypothetical protein
MPLDPSWGEIAFFFGSLLLIDTAFVWLALWLSNELAAR